MESKKLIAIID